MKNTTDPRLIKSISGVVSRKVEKVDLLRAPSSLACCKDRHFRLERYWTEIRRD